MLSFLSGARALWSRRRWAYGLYVLVAIARIPARTGFHLARPDCDTRLTLANAALSLTKIPHLLLFGLFCLLTAVQFERIDRRALGWSVVATGAVGLVVELEEGATRTGNCRLTDVLPDFVGALVVATLLGLASMVHRSLTVRRGTSKHP
jgi:hypothetical protein